VRVLLFTLAVNREDLPMPLTLLRRYLDHHHVRYIVTSHSPSFTAQETAMAAHIHGDNFAKAVMINIDHELAMLVMPATCRVDLPELARAMNARNVSLAHESQLQQLFPDCDIGAMPPLGNLYGIKTYLCNAFDTKSQIAFNAGSHFETMHMRFADYLTAAKVEWLQRGFIKPGNAPVTNTQATNARVTPDTAEIGDSPTTLH